MPIAKEEVKQQLFIDGVILHRENPKESTKKKTIRINISTRFHDFMTNIQN